MTDDKPDIDLEALARPSVQARPPRRHWIAWALPGAILLVFAVILATSLGDLLRGRVAVTVLRPEAAQAHDGEAGPAQDTVVLQAAGWAEPDPFPIQVTALTSGVVKEMRVRESDAVAAGDVVAVLYDDQATLECGAAQATLTQAKAERALAQAELDAAQTSWDYALAVTEAQKSASADAAGRASESDKRKAAQVAGEARVRVAEQELAVQQELAAANATGARQLELAQARLAEARGALAGLEADTALAQAERERALARLARAQAELELRIDDKLRLERARASLDLAEGRVSEVQRMCEQTALRLERTSVRAPAAGIVLERLAMPGTPLDTGESGKPVCTLYDPAHLRIRVDIPQADVPKIGVGQKAQILTEARNARAYSGEVIRLAHKADIQKVTLQVHVRVLDGDELLRPEMLCQVRFQGGAAGASGAGSAPGDARVRIPSALLLADSAVWVVDGRTSTAVKRKVEAGARVGDRVEVLSGLNLSDKLIDQGREALREGALVRIREER